MRSIYPAVHLSVCLSVHLSGVVIRHLRLEVGVGGACQSLGIQLQTLIHPEPPAVAHLTAQIQVQLCHQQAVRDPRQTRGTTGVGRRHVARAVEVAKVAVCRPAVGGGEFVREVLCADAVDGEREVGVGDGGVAGLDAPQGLAEGSHRGGRVEDELSTVQTVGHPVLRHVAAVADVDGDLAELGLWTGGRGEGGGGPPQYSDRRPETWGNSGLWTGGGGGGGGSASVLTTQTAL